jgi:hypothetical protein
MAYSMKKVEIKWTDIIHEGGFHTQQELDDFMDEKSMTVTQIGYLYEDDGEYLILLDSYFEDKSQFGTIHVIPKGCIKQITEL